MKSAIFYTLFFCNYVITRIIQPINSLFSYSKKKKIDACCYKKCKIGKGNNILVLFCTISGINVLQLSIEQNKFLQYLTVVMVTISF